MGVRGPVGKRTNERMGHRTKAEMEAVTKVQVSGSVKQPPAQDHWHDIARNWYVSLSESGQSIYFEPSDWAAAQYAAEVMTRNLNSGKFSAQLFGSVWSALQDLMTTEGSRRRMRLELERQIGANNEKSAEAIVLDEYRGRIFG
jgi:hypothetical protein